MAEALAESPTSTTSPEFESWGRYPKYDANLIPLQWQQDFPAVANKLDDSALPVGMGRSYGDVCLLRGGNLLVTTGMNRLLAFDETTGVLTAEAGITLAQILDFCVPRGWFLPVTPGTKYVTLGGAIANDIHGKNHHVAGTFGVHVPAFELARSDGSRMLCSRTQQSGDVRRHHRRPRPHRPHHLGPAHPQTHRQPQNRLRGHPVPRRR